MPSSKAPPSAVRPLDVRETLCRQIGDASRTLRAPGVSDEAIHKARKDLKRARANLRLLRDAVGDAVYDRANTALRDAARPLSAARDAKVMVDALDDALEREKNESRRALLVKLRGLLEAQRLEALAAVERAGDAVTSAEVFEAAWRRAERWRVARKRPAALHEGMQRIYRTARKAFAAVRSERSPEKLHEWRKQVKYLAQAIESYKPGDAPGHAQLRKRAEEVADALGHDHDLHVLHAEITRLHSSSNARNALFSEFVERRKELQSTALKEGRSLFRKKPKAFVKDLRKA